MQFKVEYLLDPADETSVCDYRNVFTGSLASAQNIARERAQSAKRLFNAAGYLIREMTEGEPIVARGTF